MASLSTPGLTNLKLDLGCTFDNDMPWRADGDQFLDFAQLPPGNISNITTLSFFYNYLSPTELNVLLRTMGAAGMAVTSLDLEVHPWRINGC